MTTGGGALDQVLARLRAAPSRTGSLIVTVYGDAILPRGGALALSDLLALMRRLGVSDGVVRTAISRLAKDGMLQGRRAGRHSAYALTDRGAEECRAAIPAIYGRLDPAWDGQLRIAFPEPGADRAGLERLGFAIVAPGVLVGTRDGPPGSPVLRATGDPASLTGLIARGWPIDQLAALYTSFLATFTLTEPLPSAPMDAMALRIMLIHEWRRIALRDPRLPAALLPEDWSGAPARRLCVSLYDRLAAASEAWLNSVKPASATPPGASLAARFID